MTGAKPQKIHGRRATLIALAAPGDSREQLFSIPTLLEMLIKAMVPCCNQTWDFCR